MRAPADPIGPLSLSLGQWLDVLRSAKAAADRANLPLIAGGVAFFGLMAVIPGLAALIALVGIFGQAGWVEQQLAALHGLAPEAAITIIHEQVTRLLASRSDQLLAGAIFNLLLSLWSALQGVRWMLMALTAVNRRAEQRSFLRRFLAAGMFTLYSFGLGVLAILLMGVAPIALAILPLQSAEEALLLFLRWPVLGGAAVAISLLLYRWGPRRRPPPWRWLWPGAVAAPLLWVLASSALAFALREFPAFGATYGSLASSVALLLWLYITAFVFLAGGALNAELEFYAQGKPTLPIAPDETIESTIGVDGAAKQTAAKAQPKKAPPVREQPPQTAEHPPH